MSSPTLAGDLAAFPPDGRQHQGASPEPAPRASYTAQVVSDAFRNWGARVGLAWVGVLMLCAVFAPLLANTHPILMKQSGRWSSPLLRNLTPPDVILLVAFVAGVILWPFRKRIPGGARLGLFVWIVAGSIPAAYWALVQRDLGVWKSDLGPLLTWIAIGVSLLAVLATLVVVPLRSSIPRVAWGWAVTGLIALAILLIVFPIRPPTVVVYDRYRQATQAGEIEKAIYAPIRYSPTDRLRDQPETRLLGPTRDHLMGTEYNGSDVLSRMIHASRIALAIGFIATGIAVLIGCLIGAVMGYFAGRTDMVGMRLIEVFEAIPTLFLLISFVAFFGRNLYLIMAIIGITSWPGYARFIRAEFLKIRTQDYVQAAIACGLPLRSVLFRHMLPNGIAPVLVSASFGVASAILSESVLSFLGLGLIDEPSWGDLLSQATGQGGAFQWWLALFPGLAIFLTVFSYNLIGEAFRDAIDPRLREGR